MCPEMCVLKCVLKCDLKCDLKCALSSLCMVSYDDEVCIDSLFIPRRGQLHWGRSEYHVRASAFQDAWPRLCEVEAINIAP